MSWLINPVAWIASIPYILMVTTLLSLYNFAWENPRIRREARTGYVLTVEATAAKAELAERQRQAAAAIDAANSLKNAVTKQQEQDAAENEARKKDLTDYAAKLKADKRSCPLTDADIKWLRK